ncbi:MAG TPA: aldose 1-epimerase [Puia sp.]|jgi:aldose 1-epimerase|nr:aldose 1-epimerase [Puia sp.]
MSFSAGARQINKLNLSILKDEVFQTEVAILPEYGAALHSFSININEHQFNIIDNYNNGDEIKKEMALSFKSAKLSPFPCRINKATYNFNGQKYFFEKKFIDGSAIHGLLYNKSFRIADIFSNKTEARIILEYNYEKDDDGYPFNYTCTVEYVLQKNNLLTIKTTVTNKSNIAIPIADGWHPYFRLDNDVNDWLMQFPSESIIEFDENLIPTENLLPYNKFSSPQLIDEIQLDNCFVLKKDLKTPVCSIFNPKNKLRLDFYTDNSYPYLQIYIPPHRKSIAIENLSAAPDCFNNKMGLILLEPGHSQIFTVQYQPSLA